MRCTGGPRRDEVGEDGERRRVLAKSASESASASAGRLWAGQTTGAPPARNRSTGWASASLLAERGGVAAATARRASVRPTANSVDGATGPTHSHSRKAWFFCPASHCLGRKTNVPMHRSSRMRKRFAPPYDRSGLRSRPVRVRRRRRGSGLRLSCPGTTPEAGRHFAPVEQPADAACCASPEYPPRRQVLAPVRDGVDATLFVLFHCPAIGLHAAPSYFRGDQGDGGEGELESLVCPTPALAGLA